MEIVIILALILLNGLLSMSEIALISARKSRLEADAKKGSKYASTALKLSNDPDRFLSTTQIGITSIGVLTGLYSGEVFAENLAIIVAKADFLAPYATTIAKTIIVVVVTYLTLVLGELVPKRLGMSRAEILAKIISSPMNFLSKVAHPLVWFLSKSTAFIVKILGIKEEENNKITEDEIKAIVREGVSGGEIQEVEQDIVERVFSLGDRDVESIMTHHSDLVWLDIADNKETIREKVMANTHDIYPVADGNPDNLKGVVDLKCLFAEINLPDFALDKLLSDAPYLPESQSVYTALETFKKADIKYGFVIDEFGNIQGVVTLKNILEALVGEIDEEQEDRDIIQREDGSYLIDGQCSFYNFLEHFDLEYLYSEHDYNTLSGLILGLLARIPVTGERLSWQDFNFEIVDMDGARIDKVLVIHNKPEE